MASTITKSEFASIILRYDAAIIGKKNTKGEPLPELDLWRRTSLPKAVASRKPPHLTKRELYRVVDCKLKRGKMRPILRLVEQNAEETVVDVTTAAFKEKDDKVAFEKLVALKGVGPATASYVLAVDRDAPLFSDEAFRWISKDGKWDAEIKYTAGEYWNFWKGVDKVAERLKVKREEVERVGFVLGREATLMETKKGKGKAEKKDDKKKDDKKQKDDRKDDRKEDKKEDKKRKLAPGVAEPDSRKRIASSGKPSFAPGGSRRSARLQGGKTE